MKKLERSKVVKGARGMVLIGNDDVQMTGQIEEVRGGKIVIFEFDEPVGEDQTFVVKSVDEIYEEPNTEAIIILMNAEENQVIGSKKCTTETYQQVIADDARERMRLPGANNVVYVAKKIGGPILMATTLDRLRKGMNNITDNN